jgi:undecaprenyl-diphosphatase
MFDTFSHLIVNLDHWLFLVLNRDIANPVFDWIFPAITNRGFWVMPGLIAAGIFIVKKRWTAMIILGLAFITVGITDPMCDKLIKPFFHRLRPCHPHYFVLGGHFLSGMKDTLSFPSSHAMNMFGQAMLFTLFFRRFWYWYFGFAALIGFSRIYVGVHYPLDVLGGAIFGIAIGFLVFLLYTRIGKFSKNRVLGWGAAKQ